MEISHEERCDRERETDINIGGNTRQKEEANSGCDKRNNRHMTFRHLFAFGYLRSAKHHVTPA